MEGSFSAKNIEKKVLTQTSKKRNRKFIYSSILKFRMQKDRTYSWILVLNYVTTGIN